MTFMESNSMLDHALNHCRKLQQERINSFPDGLIYFIQSADYIKIGITTRDGLKGRMLSLQTGNPIKLKLLKTVDARAAQYSEQSLHRLFKQYRVRGRSEWFKITESELNAILDSPDAKWFKAGLSPLYHP